MTNYNRRPTSAGHVLVVAALGVWVLGLIGCVSTTSARPKNEPGAIALRNSTGETLASVRIEDGRAPSTGPRRLGEMAPVNPDFIYVFARSELAPALPPRVKVQWRDAEGREQTAIVDITGLLKQAKGPEEALLLEIVAGGQVDARLESVTASP